MNSNSQPSVYFDLVAHLLHACHERDRRIFESCFQATSDYGWDRGPSLLIHLAATSVIDSIHDGGLWASFSDEWINNWQYYVENRHSIWGNVPNDLVRSVVLVARGDIEEVSEVGRAGRAIWQLLFIESVADNLYGTDSGKIYDFYTALFLQAEDSILQMADNGMLSFEP